MIDTRLPAALHAGFIGPGIMGRPMAARLVRGGVSLAIHARRREAAASLLAAGAEWADSPAQLAAQVGIVFIMVSDTPDVEQVLFGPGGVAEGAARGSLVVVMSTIAPEATRGFAGRLTGLGIDMIDAPVSGGEAAAVAGSLSIMVGGPAASLERARPLLALMGSSIVHVGGHGAGQVAQSCNQVIAAVTIEAVAEALTLARRLGADPARVCAALAGGFAASRVLDEQGARMLSRDFSAGFRASLHGKSLGIVVDSAHALGLDLPATAIVAQQLNALVGAGDGDLDSSAMIRVLERMLGEER
jgi:2-hydroxy-3-oxopropionate reductase